MHLVAVVLATLGLLAASAPARGAAPFAITHLRCEYHVDPIGVAVARPRLGWELVSDRRGQRQTAYQIVVGRSREQVEAGTGAVWDSGKVASSQSTQIPYGGPALGSGERVYWRVRAWDGGGAAVWSPTASWEMGLLGARDWSAHWIGLPPPPGPAAPPLAAAGMKWMGLPDDRPSTGPMPAERFYRRTFELPRARIRRAAFTLTAADQFILRINGATAGGARDWHFLERIDVTELLVPGRNTVAIQVRRKGDPGGLVGQLRVELESGDPVVIDTDARWRVSDRRQVGWLEPGFDDAGWVAARELAPLGRGPWAAVDARTVRDQVTTPPAYLRKDFTLAQPVRRARLYATALGLYELSLNGRRVGDRVLTPGWTDYNKRVLYQSYDVTALLRPGANALGAIVAEGFYAGRIGWLTSSHGSYGPDPQKLLAQLDVELADGSRLRVVSDGTWKAATGAITLADLMDGEHHDARREPRGWDRAGFDDAAWTPAHAYEGEKRNLVADAGAPIKVIEDMEPRRLAQPRPGVWIYDLGQNMVGWARLHVRGPAGTEVKLRFAEMLNPDGTLYTENLRAIKATDRYVLRGGGVETWEPRFTFHGFRYVEVTGFPGRPVLASLTGRVVHADMPVTGTLVTSNPMLNQLQHNILWGQKGNFVTVPTDCPQRDERLGWTGDAQIFVGTACLEMDVAAFFTKWMDDMVDAQSPEGAFPDVAPRLGAFNDGAPAWGDAGIIVPWTMYRCYGDRALLEKHYAAMVRWIEYVHAANPTLLWTKRTGNNYGDWVSIDADTDKDVLATAYFAQSTRLVARIAAVLGRQEDAARYETLFQAIRDAFARAYVAPDGKVKSDTQTAYLLALRFDLLPAALRPAATQHLVAQVEKRDWHLSTGFLGVGHLLPALSENGRLDVAYRLLESDTFPSWGYSIKHGATTIWERWDGWTHDKGFQTPAMNSFNHYSFGSVGEWMFHTIGGIDAGAPGYDEVIIRPQPGGSVTSARAELRSPRGPVATDWRVTGKTFRLRVTLPMNADARVYLPYPATHAEGERLPDGAYRIGSGRYEFAATTQ